MSFEWDVRNAEANFENHGVHFSESLPVFEDDYAITIVDDESDPGEQKICVAGYGRKRAGSGGGVHLSWSEYPNHFRAAGGGA